MIHEARVIPTDGRPPLSPEIRQWMGESRGHWEGNTLVVVTTNYQVGPPIINLAVVGSPPGNRFPYSEQMKTTERIVRLNDDTWLYEITTEDPLVLTRPFTVRYPMRHDASYFTPEYACHEDNTIVRNYTQTSRHERANPTPEAPQPPVEVAPAVADLLAGRWVGRPRIVTIDVDIEHVFHAAERRSVAVLGRDRGRRYDHGRRRERAGRSARHVSARGAGGARPPLTKLSSWRVGNAPARPRNC
jgi:hypothetical protein